MTGESNVDGVRVGEVSGTFGNGDLVFASFLGSERLRSLPGVEGHEDRIRGVALMAY